MSPGWVENGKQLISASIALPICQMAGDAGQFYCRTWSVVMAMAKIALASRVRARAILRCNGIAIAQRKLFLLEHQDI
jgi:hypothetical protein